MTEERTETKTPSDLPEAVVRTRKPFSIVWVVPLVALLIGGWLAYKAVTEKGPTVTITFRTAEGLEAGKTKIKYKDVDMGQVEAIDLSKDLSHVVVTAELAAGAEDFLTEEAKFWVVRARVAAGEVSGLGTLFSGAYIGMEPGRGGKRTRTFKGLEIPPVVTEGLPGRHFSLRAESLSSLDVGSPVFFREIKVGQVVAYRLDEDGKGVTIKVFIHAPHHDKVMKNTRFWSAGGLDVSIDANGIEVESESLVAMMLGGIAFETPPQLEPAGPAEEGDVFKLYKNRQSIFEKEYTQKVYYVLYFTGSVRGLSEGAPVEFRGIRVGEVTDIRVEYDRSKLEVRIPVIVATEPERFASVGGPGTMSPLERAQKLVEKGLRAQLKTGSFLTGQLFVDLDFYPDAPSGKVVQHGKYMEIPTIPRPMEEIAANVSELLEKLNRIPIEQIGRDLADTVEGADRLVNSSELREAVQALKEALEQAEAFAETLNTEVAAEITATLEDAQKTLEAAESAVSPDAALQYELRQTLKELRNAARALQNMAGYLERHPEALIRGKGSD